MVLLSQHKKLTKWSTDQGKPAYKTWVGKPTHLEHDNQDPSKAKGIIIDTVMQQVRGAKDAFKVMALISFDRTKDRDLFNRIDNNQLNSYSMGAWVDGYRCAYCEEEYEPGEQPKM